MRGSFLRFIVTKNSDNGTFKKGDKFWYLKNGDIMIHPEKEPGGWIAKCEIEKAQRGMACVEDKEYKQQMIAKLEKELEKLKSNCQSYLKL